MVKPPALFVLACAVGAATGAPNRSYRSRQVATALEALDASLDASLETKGLRRRNGGRVGTSDAAKAAAVASELKREKEKEEEAARKAAEAKVAKDLSNRFDKAVYWAVGLHIQTWDQLALTTLGNDLRKTYPTVPDPFYDPYGGVYMPCYWDQPCDDAGLELLAKVVSKVEQMVVDKKKSEPVEASAPETSVQDDSVYGLEGKLTKAGGDIDKLKAILIGCDVDGEALEEAMKDKADQVAFLVSEVKDMMNFDGECNEQHVQDFNLAHGGGLFD